MSKIISQKCSKIFLLLAPVLLLFLALPIAFAPMQANIFVSVASAAEFSYPEDRPPDPNYDEWEPYCKANPSAFGCPGANTSGDDTSGDDTSGDDTSGDDTSGDDTSGDDTSSTTPDPAPEDGGLTDAEIAENNRKQAQRASINETLGKIQGSDAPSIILAANQHNTALDNSNRIDNLLAQNNPPLRIPKIGYTAADLNTIKTELTNVVLSDKRIINTVANLAMSEVNIVFTSTDDGGADGTPVTPGVPSINTGPQFSMSDTASTVITGNNYLASVLGSDAFTQIQSVTLDPNQYTSSTVALADMLVNGPPVQMQTTSTSAFGSPTEERALVAQFVSKFVDEVFGSPQVTSGWSVFLTPYGNFSSSTNGSSHGNTYGLSGGLTHIFNEKFSLGMHFDLGSSQNYADSLNTESRTFTGSLGLNANYKFTPEWYVGASFTASLSNTYNDYKTSSYLGSHSADNNHGGYSLVAALNTGYIFQINKNHALVPEIGLSYVYSHTDANDITWNNGGSFLNMYNNATSYDALYGNISLRWLGTFEINENSSIKPFVSVGLRQNLSGHNMQSSMVYDNTRYNNEATPDMTTFTTTAGIEWVWNNFSLNLNYNGAYGAERVNHGGALTFGWSF